MVRCFCILAIITISSCENETQPTVDDRDFLPIAVDNEWTYEYTETQYSVTQEPKITTYLYREQISQLIDKENQIYKLVRTIKPKEGSTWNSLSPILLKVNANRVTIIDEKSDNDLLFFPVQNGSTWQNGDITKTILSTAKYFATQSNQVIVETQNDSSAIDLKRKFNMYELGTGLSHAEEVDLAYCQETSSCVGKGIISSGTKKVYKLIDKKIN